MITNKKIIIVLLGLAVFESQVFASSWFDNKESVYSARVIFATLLARKGLLNAYNTHPAMQTEAFRPMVQDTMQKMTKDGDFVTTMQRFAETKGCSYKSYLALLAVNPALVNQFVDSQNSKDKDAVTREDLSTLGEIHSFISPEKNNITGLSSVEKQQLSSIRKAFLGEQELPVLEAQIRAIAPCVSNYSLRLPCFETYKYPNSTFENPLRVVRPE